MRMTPCTGETVAEIKASLAAKSLSAAMLCNSIPQAVVAIRAGWGEIGNMDAEFVLAELILHGREDFEDDIHRWAGNVSLLWTEVQRLRREVREACEIVLGRKPAKDADGNDMPETTPEEERAAWRARKALYNDFLMRMENHLKARQVLEERIAAAER